jgi:tRNA pseudouridine55 synthase
VDGVRAYKKARRNEPVELEPVTVTVHALDVLGGSPGSGATAESAGADPTLLRLRVACSSGFYVRSLAHDIGRALGCGAHLEALRRTRAGQFHLADAVPLARLESPGAALLVPPAALLPTLPAVTPGADGLRRVQNGNTLAPGHLDGPPRLLPPAGRVRILDGAGGLVAVAEMRPDGLLHPLLVLR